MAETRTPTRLEGLHLTVNTVVSCDAYLLILAKDGHVYRQDYDAMFLVSFCSSSTGVLLSLICRNIFVITSEIANHFNIRYHYFKYPRQVVNVKPKMCQLAITADEKFAVSVEGKLYKWCLSDAR